MSVFAVVSCNEKLNISEYHAPSPSISGFSPSEGPVGTQITIEGDGLGNITSAMINGQDVEIKYCISNKTIILKTTANASSGKITLEGPEGTAESAETFTFTYPVPEVNEDIPEFYYASTISVITGENLNAISRITFGDAEAEIMSSSRKELVFMVPDLATVVDVGFWYYNGSGYVSAKAASDVSIRRQLPEVASLSKEDGIVTGDEITVTGQFLNFVETITLGGIQMPVTSVNSAGTELKFKVNDDKSFPDGDNSGDLVFISYGGSEVHTIRENFSFFVPKFYTWKGVTLNSNNSVEELNHILCLETGEIYSVSQFATDVDPVAAANPGGSCSAKNTVSPSVTEEDYYSVKPYTFFMYLGSGCYFYGPANNNNRLTGYSGFATPIIKFRTLCEDIPEEKAIIDDIKAGTFTSDDFTPELLSRIDLEQTGASTVDGWSNVPNGEFGAFKAEDKKGSTNHRPWAPILTDAKETINADPGTVALILYFKPSWDGDPKATVENIRKFGFMNITNLFQDATIEKGRHNSATFDVYWQRTPMSE